MNEFSKRLPDGHEHRNTIDLAFGIATRFRQKAQEIKADKRLSSQGHLEQIQAAVRNGPITHLKQLRAQVDADAEHLQQRRGELVLKAPDPKDVVAAMDRAEIRSWLRSLPIGERTRHALEGDERIIGAVINAPSALSGVTDEVHARATGVALDRQFGPALKKLAEEEDALAVVDSALKVASTQLLSEAGIKSDDGLTEGEI